MKIKDLISALKTMPQESEVTIHIGHGNMVPLAGTVIASGNNVTIFTKHEKVQNVSPVGLR